MSAINGNDERVRRLEEEAARLGRQCRDKDAELDELRRRAEGFENEVLKLRILMDNIPDVIHFKDKEGRYTWANKAKAQSMGLADPKEVAGKSAVDFYSQPLAWEVLADEKKIMSTGRPLAGKLEKSQSLDGKLRWYLVTKFPLFDSEGNMVGTGGISRDVTERKRVEDELAQASMLLDTLLDNMPDAVYFKDTQSRFIRVSRSTHLEGMKSPEAAIGKTDLDFFSDEHARQAFEDEQEIMRTGVPIIDKIEKETYHNKEDTWVSTTKVPYYDREGKVAGIVGISRDVTERFKAQEAVRKAKEDLEIRVQERTAALVQEIRQHLRMQKALRESEGRLQEANRVLQTRVSQLNYLNATAHQLSQFTLRRDLVPAILSAFTECYPGLEVALCEKDGDAFRSTAVSPGLDTPEAREACAEVLRRSPGLAEGVLVQDRLQDPRIGKAAWPGLDHLPAYLSVPLLLKDRFVAVAQILAAKEFANWYRQEQGMIDTLAAQAAISLCNANNFEELEKRARVQSELEVAQGIQRRFTPQDRPFIPRISLKGLYHPAYEVGGDYLDYFQTDEGDWVVVIADVSGKGIPAALVMTMLRSTFRAEARYERSAKQLLCAVNDMMSQDLDEKSFVTALCLLVDKEGRSMSYARAGHPPLVLKRGSGGEPEQVNPRGIALGMVDSLTFRGILEEEKLELGLGDRFLVFTDGLVEARNSARQAYGLPRVLSRLSSCNGGGPESMLGSLLDDVHLFMGSEPYHDDLTILAMEVTG